MDNRPGRGVTQETAATRSTLWCRCCGRPKQNLLLTLRLGADRDTIRRCSNKIQELTTETLTLDIMVTPAPAILGLDEKQLRLARDISATVSTSYRSRNCSQTMQKPSVAVPRPQLEIVSDRGDRGRDVRSAIPRLTNRAKLIIRLINNGQRSRPHNTAPPQSPSTNPPTKVKSPWKN